MATPILQGQDPSSTPTLSSGAIQQLVRDNRLHSSMFTSQKIFDLEIERIFHRTWLFVGHTSEVPNEGDFRLRMMGRQPVILVHGKGGEVNVFLNRCRHRGAAIAEREAGNAKFFKCWWHGWIYDTQGTLVDIPRADGYEPGFKSRIGGLARPRVESYRGFVFASLDPNVPELLEHLGRTTAWIDYMMDASPLGGITLTAGVEKTFYRGNWKLTGMDGYHTDTVHASVLEVWRKNSNDGLGVTHRGDVTSDRLSRARAFDRGHTLLDYLEHKTDHLDGYLNFLRSLPGGADYIDATYARYGEEYGKNVLALAGDPHVAIYPNLQLIGNQLKIIVPLAPDRTQIVMLPVMLQGVPDSINEARLRVHESFHGPASAGTPDDHEVFERAQRGLQGSVESWIDISRGLHRQQIDSDGTISGHLSDEVAQRGQAREWLRLMTRE
jgi:nitrite reductase/ring-hydroxylating ferredoxin subunit